ncbi:hypothetical protein [Clostridium thermarum]|uniref:hypothetical protein n=1 Tax=Clostridium thermarum TaxID=1716543 RepID=UPI0013D2DFB5|nr:hypothetical protein [Clostridium thermarum]
MKYKLLSFLVVLTTTVSVAVMLLSSKLQTDVEPYEEVKLVQKENEEKQAHEEQALKDQSSDSSKANDENTEEEDSKTEQEEEGSIPQEHSFVVIDNRKNKGQSQTKQEEEEYPDSAAVFKVESYTIEDRLTLAEKARLLTVAAKISPVDYARINNYLYDENASRGIINTFSLLKTRLSSKDYEKVKDIAEKYMYVDTIEAYIDK